MSADLSSLPLLVDTKTLRDVVGLTPTGIAHVKRDAGVTKIGRFYYVARDDLERVLAEREVKST